MFFLLSMYFFFGWILPLFYNLFSSDFSFYVSLSFFMTRCIISIIFLLFFCSVYFFLFNSTIFCLYLSIFMEKFIPNRTSLSFHNTCDDNDLAFEMQQIIQYSRPEQWTVASTHGLALWESIHHLFGLLVVITRKDLFKKCPQALYII